MKTDNIWVAYYLAGSPKPFLLAKGEGKVDIGHLKNSWLLEPHDRKATG